MTKDFDQEKFKVWALPNLMLLHWVINPGLAFNELVLGQRVPKVTLIDKTMDAPLMERQFVPCPECGALNDGRMWSKSNSFGHWFGYVCPECNGRIPCLWNFTSLIILGITFPLWIWFKKPLEEKWFQREKRRFTKVSEGGLGTVKDTKWHMIGIRTSLLMFILLLFIRIGSDQVSILGLVILSIICAFGGLAFGLFMKTFLSSRK